MGEKMSLKVLILPMQSQCDLDLLTSRSNQFIFVLNCTQSCKFGKIPTKWFDNLLVSHMHTHACMDRLDVL